MRSTLLRVLLVPLLVLVTLLGATQEAGAATTRHAGHFWVCGITVASASGKDVMDLGFSSTICTGGATYAATVTNHFAAIRRQHNTGPFRLLKATAITHPAGTSASYRRQALRLRIVSNRVTHIGQFTFDQLSDDRLDGFRHGQLLLPAQPGVVRAGDALRHLQPPGAAEGI